MPPRYTRRLHSLSGRIRATDDWPLFVKFVGVVVGIFVSNQWTAAGVKSSACELLAGKSRLISWGRRPLGEMVDWAASTGDRKFSLNVPVGPGVYSVTATNRARQTAG
ncbi:hypothetical protein M513_11232 [Trichuris suis]|nr:hypothetical protein M513_11232 [Trichuris suis]